MCVWEKEQAAAAALYARPDVDCVFYTNVSAVCYYILAARITHTE